MTHSLLQPPAKTQAFKLLKSGHLQEARALCQSYCREIENDPEGWCLLSTINGALGFIDEAEQCGRRAIALAPEYTPAYYNTAVALLAKRKLNEAVTYFQKVIEREPNHGVAHYLMGKCLELQVGRYDEAIESYENALQTTPAPPRDAFLDLGDLYERLGRTDEAYQCLERLLEAYPGDPKAKLHRARMDENNGDLGAARICLDGLLNRTTPLPPSERAPILHRFGIVLDKLGEYERAYEAFKKCQRIAAEAAPNCSGGSLYERINRCRGVSTSNNIALWKKHTAKDNLPAPIFLVGFPRSGTTLMERIISSHPEVIPSSEEGLIGGVITKLNTMVRSRLGYPYNLNEVTGKQVSALRQEYWNLALQRCSADAGEKRFLDKLPLSIIDLCLINRIFPEARIILALRDPRDVCLSCFMQLFQANDAMANFYELESTAQFYDATMKLWYHYEDVLDMNLFKLRYEDLVANFEPRVRDLLDFLGLDWDEHVLKYHENRKYKIDTPSFHDTCKPIFSRAVRRWTHYEDHMQTALPYLHAHIERLDYT